MASRDTKGRFRSKDKGAAALIKRLTQAIPAVQVGVFGDAAAQKHQDGNGATVGEIANAHEFGARSWLRASIDPHRAAIKTATKRAAEAVYKGQLTPEQAATQIGEGMVGIVKARIVSGISPPLSQAYLPRKLKKYPGATTPLIGSSQFIGSITAQLRTGRR